MGLAAVLLTHVTADTPMAGVIGVYAIFGFGFSVANAPITNTAVSGMPREQAGVAAAINSTSRQVGTTLGVAVLGAIIAGGPGTRPGAIALDFAASAARAWWVVAGLGLTTVILGIVTTGPWARRTAARDPSTSPPVTADV